jgi:hypothetical protein
MGSQCISSGKATEPFPSTVACEESIKSLLSTLIALLHCRGIAWITWLTAPVSTTVRELDLGLDGPSQLGQATLEGPDLVRVDSGDTIGRLIGVTPIWRIWPLGHTLGLVQPFVSRHWYYYYYLFILYTSLIDYGRG